MKKLKLCFFLGLLANSAYAQNFDLNMYKFRYQKFRGLLYNVNLGGSNSYNFSNNSDNYDLNKLVTYKTKSPGFNFDRGSARLQGDQVAGVRRPVSG